MTEHVHDESCRALAERISEFVDGELPGLESAFPELAAMEPALFLDHVRQVLDPADEQQQ